MPSAVAVRPIEGPFIVHRVEFHSSDSLSGPLSSEIFPPGRSTFNNRHCHSSNVNFHSHLILKVRWDDPGCVLANLPQVEFRNAGHSETLRNSVVGVPNKPWWPNDKRNRSVATS